MNHRYHLGMQVKPLEIPVPSSISAAPESPATVHIAGSSDMKVPRSLVHPFADFWLLGGASIAVWLVMAIGQAVRGDVPVIEQRFMQVASTFALLSLVCNHPHFISSYKMAYSRGWRFALEHWFCLIAVPAALTGLYGFAYINFSREIELSGGAAALNRLSEAVGFGPRLSSSSNMGTEFVALSIWIMYLTIGWHYAKQAFGCMMVYARFDDYPLSSRQRRLIKLSVFSIGLYQFCYFTAKIAQPGSDGSPFRFLGVPLAPFQIPEWTPFVSGGLVIALASLVSAFVFVPNWRAHRRIPSWNFLVPWIALHVWWFPVFHQTEFYFMVVPFFHSLQYLPFAWKVASAKSKEKRWSYGRLTTQVLMILAIGFLAFEFVPAALDTNFSSGLSYDFWFFSVAIPVFINIHHFFLDAAIWKFDQREVRESLFGSAEPEPSQHAS